MILLFHKLFHALKGWFYKAYPSAQRGSAEAEDMGKAVLSSQFVSGLLPEIKSKVAGSEGDLGTDTSVPGILSL